MHCFPIFILLFTGYCQKANTIGPEYKSKEHRRGSILQQQLDQKQNNERPVVMSINEPADRKMDVKLPPQPVTISPVKSSSTDISVTSLNHTSSPNTKSDGQIDPALDEVNEVESGAITRGILVVVGISCLLLLYVGIKTYRRKKLDKSKIIIRRYGIRTHRTDIEMEPLPLSDDEEDETLFDLTASRTTS